MNERTTRRGREVHVYRDATSRRWVVTRRRRRRSRHRRQDTAVRAARRLATRHRADVSIHARNGRIRSKNSYGNESRRQG